MLTEEEKVAERHCKTVYEMTIFALISCFKTRFGFAKITAVWFGSPSQH
jgi:hypothetical protein